MKSSNSDSHGGTTVFLSVMSLFASAQSMPAADVYSFESLTVGELAGGQDNWSEAPDSGRGVIGLDSEVNGTKVIRHDKQAVFDLPALLTRVNDSSFDFLPFSGSETNAVIQFETTGEYISMFALGTDLNGDGLLTAAQGELGPAFGVFDRKFRIQEANLGTAYDDGFNEGGGDANSGNDWYRIQLRMNFSASDGDGLGTLYFKNLTDRNVNWHTVTGMRNRPLGLKRLQSESGPSRWNAIWLQLLSNGNSIPSADNLVPNASTILIDKIELVAGEIEVGWRGGLGPYQLQQRTNLIDGNWQDSGATTILSTGKLPFTQGSAFIRIVEP